MRKSLRRVTDCVCLFQVTMAAVGSSVVPRGPRGHLASLLPVCRGRASLPVDQKPGSRVWRLQLSRQGAFFPSRVF